MAEKYANPTDFDPYYYSIPTESKEIDSANSPKKSNKAIKVVIVLIIALALIFIYNKYFK